MKFALLGDPVAHSKSPAMHAAAFRALGVDHTYEAIQTLDIAPYVDALRRGEFGGLNVTIPHKKAAAVLADETDFGTQGGAGVGFGAGMGPGAANTLVRKRGPLRDRVVAHNTDIPAIASRLDALGARAGRAIVLGSGGAARAVAAALRDRAIMLAMRARSAEWRADPSWESKTTIVVQATSAGMTGRDSGEEVARVVAWDALPDDAVALELIYDPMETPFLKAARARGLKCENGLEVLVEQGALALELWLGVAAPREAMRAAAEQLVVK